MQCIAYCHRWILHEHEQLQNSGLCVLQVFCSPPPQPVEISPSLPSLDLLMSMSTCDWLPGAHRALLFDMIHGFPGEV